MPVGSDMGDVDTLVCVQIKLTRIELTVTIIIHNRFFHWKVQTTMQGVILPKAENENVEVNNLQEGDATAGAKSVMPPQPHKYGMKVWQLCWSNLEAAISNYRIELPRPRAATI